MLTLELVQPSPVTVISQYEAQGTENVRANRIKVKEDEILRKERRGKPFTTAPLVERGPIWPGITHFN